MEALVQEAIDFASENPEPIAAQPKEEEEKKGGDQDPESSLDDIPMSEDEDEEFNLGEDMR